MFCIECEIETSESALHAVAEQLMHSLHCSSMELNILYPWWNIQVTYTRISRCIVSGLHCTIEIAYS